MLHIWSAWAAIFPLNSLGHYVTWHWLNISVANLVVIGLMVVVFVVALFVPFPGRRERHPNASSAKNEQ